ncbi:NAD(P)-dependent dehydrogenase (short-subunit alcohol dehydrogenase family) [Natranaerovirga hydrolytica]|uniref:NAD(P)-dependent dehydrogenase (Short-subunit alcohol dehydrogenase family) n=1 Tax=Natranaerovirga hydrolytica TaxID=680378 RepID=A0A4R1MBZ7_9FIRM|nr:SDR family NAD(P)-dependent oxidoreductase [Natranaerovirga hydrolytica]TCK89092.1 NAD(P)-dependent dehydrogenase (short-subunit alcohol dehydrogenase family) [Natranaerovirga hydrolytica]
MEKILKVLLVSMLVLALLTACSDTQAPKTPEESNNEPVVQVPVENEDGGTSVGMDRDRFGLGAYNTEQVVEELLYIEANTEPIDEAHKKRILVTGSTGGLGQLTAMYLIERGHEVVVHARNESRAEDVRRDLPNAFGVVIGDFSDLEQTRQMADQINEFGTFDVIIHNAGVYGAPAEEMLNVNSLSPYILTSLVNKPKHLIYITSDLHRSGSLKFDEIVSDTPNITYSDTKLQIITLSMTVSRYWPDVQVNAIQPGWVATLMGFHDGNTTTPDDLRAGYMTYVWLSEGLEEGTDVTGGYFFQSKVDNSFNSIIHDETAQDQLMEAYEMKTGIPFPRNQE